MEVIAIYVEEQWANMGLEQIQEEYGYRRTVEAKKYAMPVPEETASIIYEADIVYMMDAYEEEKIRSHPIWNMMPKWDGMMIPK